MTIDDDIFGEVFSWEGGVQLNWEVASRDPNVNPDTQQPVWDSPASSNGVIYAEPVVITAIFRSQSRWLSFRQEGEFDHGEATLTTPIDVRPGYVDRRVRDRFTVLQDFGDAVRGRVFYPAAPAVPFNFANVQRAWRVQLQSASQANRLVP